MTVDDEMALQGDTPFGNPLLSALEPAQFSLLSIIWETVSQASALGHDVVWPIWDYVAREYYNRHPNDSDAASVFNGMPSLPRATWRDTAYGLVWKNENNSFIAGSDKVGLTIAGIHRLRLAGSMNVNIDDELTGIVADLAAREAQLTGTPTSVAREIVPLSEYTEWLRISSRDKPFVLSIDVVDELLQRECARFVSTGSHSFSLEGQWTRQYVGVRNAASYIDIVYQASEAKVERGVTESPLTLIQTLDYLSYVIVERQVWKGKERFVNAPDLESASSLSGEATTADEFTKHMLGFYNVVDKLRIPPIPAADPRWAHKTNQDRARTMNALEYWLGEYFGKATFPEEVTAALADLRAAINLRQLGAHSNPETRKNAVKNLRRLGLPDYLSDWGAAWTTVRRTSSSAFDAIRRQLQSSAGPNS